MKCIKAATILHYLKAAHELLHRTGLRPDYIHEGNTTKWITPIANIITELQRWEAVPDRKEPVTPDMLKWLRAKASNLPATFQDNLLEAMADWVEVGLFNGNRLTEWAQPSRAKGLDKPLLIPITGEARAFTLADVQFHDDRFRRVTHEQALADPSLVYRCELCWRVQKNGDNGQKILYMRKSVDVGMSLVSAMLRIVDRFARLVGLDQTHVPLAIYRHDKNTLRYIAAPDIEATLQSAARGAYGIHSPRDLAKWSSHSLRVGACVILHTGGSTPTNIKALLRWKSDTFMTYLRHIRHTAQEHQEVMEAALAIVDFY